MKRSRIQFGTKYIKYGGYSMMMTGIIIVILIMVNIVASSMNKKFDLTKSQLFSVSNQTKTILDKLEDDVTIYVLEETGKENTLFKNILENYESSSNHIKLIYKDPILYPLFGEKYKKDGAIMTGSMIVESNDKYKILDPYSFYNMQYDKNNQVQIQSYAIEEKVTNAIEYVTGEETHKIYAITGHEEKDIPHVLEEQLQKENYEILTVSLLEEHDFNPKDILVIISPKRDFLEEEANKLDEFLGQGGKAVMLLDYTMPTLPNLDKTLARYGIEVQKGIVFEGDQSFMYPGYPNYILPYLTKHEMTQPLIDAQIPVMLPFALGLKETDIKVKETKIIPLLTTSEKAYLKTNLEATTYEKEIGDIGGSLNVAIAVKETVYTGKLPQDTKLIVVGSSFLLDTERVPLESIGNLDFIMNSFNWLLGKEKLTYIRPKSQESYQLSLNFNQLIGYGILFAVAMPLIIIGIGIIVWLRRKHL